MENLEWNYVEKEAQKEKVYILALIDDNDLPQIVNINQEGEAKDYKGTIIEYDSLLWRPIPNDDYNWNGMPDITRKDNIVIDFKTVFNKVHPTNRVILSLCKLKSLNLKYSSSHISVCHSF